MPDALLVVSFGGPDGPADVEPFLDNVLRGRDVPVERRHQVAGQYLEMGGASPLNAINRRLIADVAVALENRRRPLPVYWGNRNWKPYLADAVRAMRDDGITRAVAVATSAYASYSGCRQYLDDIDAARAEVGFTAPEIIKARPFFNHPGFVAPLADGLRAAVAVVGPDAPVLMSAHSIPMAQAATCDYERQLEEAARLVADAAGVPPTRWSVVYQSRSGPPSQPWLEPDVGDSIAALPENATAVVVVPLGFVADHMEVVYDLDRRLAAAAEAQGIRVVRSATPAGDPRFVEMVADLVEETLDPDRPRLAVGSLGPAPCPCVPGCCPRPGRPAAPSAGPAASDRPGGPRPRPRG